MVVGRLGRVWGGWVGGACNACAVVVGSGGGREEQRVAVKCVGGGGRWGVKV